MEITLSRKSGLLVAETETTELFFSGDRIASDAIETIRRLHPGCDVILSGEVADEIEPAPQSDLAKHIFELGAAMNRAFAAQLRRPILPNGCPECGSSDIRVEAFDFGRSSETGYSDSGERHICRACGHVEVM